MGLCCSCRHLSHLNMHNLNVYVQAVVATAITPCTGPPPYGESNLSIDDQVRMTYLCLARQQRCLMWSAATCGCVHASSIAIARCAAVASQNPM